MIKVESSIQNAIRTEDLDRPDTDLIFEFAEKLKNEKTAAQKWDLMNRELVQNGFSGATYVMFPAMTADGFAPEMLCLSTYNEDFVDLYVNEGLAADDYAALHCAKHNTSPAIWSNLKVFYQTPRQQLFDEIATDYNLRDGLIVPFHETSGFIMGGIGMAFDPEVEAEARTHLEHKAETILGMCNIFDQQMKEPETRIDALKLSNRHIECLRYLCLGLSDKEIAERMNLRPKTVENYVGTAMRRLKARNRHHATAKAIMLGIVTP